MAPPANGIRVCATPGCETMTRSSKYRAKDHPTTTLRMPGGVCVNCYKPTFKPCTGCGSPLRVSNIPVDLAPGTKQRYADGMCKICWYLHNPDHVVNEAPVEVEELTPEKLAHTIRGLESFMARRRARLAVA